MAFTEVRKTVAYIEGKIVPLSPEAEEGFAWAGWCNFPGCEWSTLMGGWRDAFDFAYYHAKTHADSPEDEQVAFWGRWGTE